MHRQERGGLFYVLFRHGGRRIKRAAGSTWGAADKKLREARVALDRGVPIDDVLAHVFGDAVHMTFRAAAPHYLDHVSTKKRATTLQRDAKRLRLICQESWAGKLLSAIDRKDLERWLAQRAKPREEQRDRKPRRGETAEAYAAAPDRTYTYRFPGASVSTLNRDLALVSVVFKWAVRLGHARENPAAAVERGSEKGRKRGTYLTGQECAALIESAWPVLAPILTAAIHTGMRKGELMALRWSMVDLARGSIVLPPGVTKSKTGRVVPLTGVLLGLLTELHAKRPTPALDRSDFVFVHTDGAPFTESSLRVVFEPTVARCEGIPLQKRQALRFHDLRHTAASLMIAEGVSLPHVGGVLGHSNPQTTQRYVELRDEAVRAAVDRLGDALGAKPPTRGKRRAK